MSTKSGSRNSAVGPGVNRLSKSQLCVHFDLMACDAGLITACFCAHSYSKKALYKRPHNAVASKKAAEKDHTATKTVKVRCYSRYGDASLALNVVTLHRLAVPRTAASARSLFRRRRSSTPPKTLPSRADRARPSAKRTFVRP